MIEITNLFEKAISEILHHIGMNSASFQVKHSYSEDPDSALITNGKSVKPCKDGFDEIVFEVSTNAGEDFYPLQKIASGGEISRIMLAIKSVLAETDQIPVLIFDEIDSGISGRIAQIVGKNLSELAKYRIRFTLADKKGNGTLLSAEYVAGESGARDRVLKKHIR